MKPSRTIAGRGTHRLALASPLSLALLTALFVACGAPSHPNTDQRMWTTEFEIRVSSDVVPPRALEPITYTVTVRDRKSRQPVANGQGRIFATNADGKTIYDGFTYGPEVGAYHARLMFLTAGDWMMSLQFRLDSTKALQRPPDDWRQEVGAAAELGETRKP